MMKRRMYVVKRDKREEPVMFDKITSRIQKFLYGLDRDYVDEMRVSQKVCAGVYPGVTTESLDELAAETAAHLTSEHPDYGFLAARIAVSNLHKTTIKSFFGTITKLYSHVDKKSGRKAPMISEEVFQFISENKERLDSEVLYNRDYDYDYFGFKTLERSYLLKIDGRVVERPQHMLMRVACGIHTGDIDAVLETYEHLSRGWFTQASPTLFNAGTPNPQLSSCFLLTIKGDSMEGICDTLKDTALISKNSGGIGLAVSRIRATGAHISTTNGTSNGLVPMIRVYNNMARYVDQGGKRKGAFAIYLEPWHADICEFLELPKKHGSEELRARDLFYGLWVPDLFMQRVKANKHWSLFCPHTAPGLEKVWGKKFEELYESYEEEKKAKTVMRARELWIKIMQAQVETGNPYMLYKDACNGKSNQQNLGTIESSNLCTEIVEFTSPNEIAVCNLGSIALPKCIDSKAKKFDHDILFRFGVVLTKNMNRILDINRNPLPEAAYSNKRNRPIGMGVQGLADTFILLGMPFESKEAQILNRDIFETLYFAAMTASCDLAEKEGAYETFWPSKDGERSGSPLSEGKFQFDLWGYKPESGRWDWEALRKRIMKYGVRNSLTIAPMPTASTSQILGNNECFEPYTSNIYQRRTLAGEFVVVNKHLLRDLTKLGIWTPELRQKIIAHDGSVQRIEEIPDHLKRLYKTVWEMSNKILIDMAAARAVFIDQSQSMNIFMAKPTVKKLTSMHFYGWSKGLKTGMYYLRTKAATEAIKFTLDHAIVKASLVPSAAPASLSPAVPSFSAIPTIPAKPSIASIPARLRFLPDGLPARVQRQLAQLGGGEHTQDGKTDKPQDKETVQARKVEKEHEPEPIKDSGFTFTSPESSPTGVSETLLSSSGEDLAALRLDSRLASVESNPAASDSEEDVLGSTSIFCESCSS